MRQLFAWILAIVVLIVMLDEAFGAAFNAYVEKIGLKGDYENSENIFRRFDSDLVILGSSVALNSINPSTLRDSLGITAVSGGGNGQTFPYYLTSLKAVIEQKKPATVILGMVPTNLTGEGAGTRYNFLAPYYGKNIADIDSCLNAAYGSLLMKSNFYRLNTIWFRILLYNFISSGVKGENGFVGKPVTDFRPDTVVVDPVEYGTVSAERRREFVEFLELCRANDVRLLVLFTPVMHRLPAGFDDSIARETAELAQRYGAEFYDDRVLAPFGGDNTLFYNDIHLNLRGSEIYTDTIINRLR